MGDIPFRMAFPGGGGLSSLVLRAKPGMLGSDLMQLAFADKDIT
jgi:hypothetical protein